MKSNGRATPADVVLISGDARKVPLADESVQCIVTSPPYWGLRKYAGEQELIWPGWGHLRDEGLRCDEYGHEWTEERRGGISGGQNNNCKADNPEGPTNRDCPPSTHGTCARCGAWRGAYGLEPTVEMYVAHSLEILRELRRVLRKDGVLFWNLGDSYCAHPNQRSGNNDDLAGWKQQTNIGSRTTGSRYDSSIKPKDLVLMPFRVVLAAQADGWWVRSVIVWAKPNPMPESVTDRPTDSYEHILMLTKSARYFWDADAVREPVTGGTHSRGNGDGGPKARERAEEGNHVGWAESTRGVIGYKPGHDERDGKERFCSGTGGYVPTGGRNMRNLWEFPTQPYAGAHFATFPEELPRRCILAATSARGCCAQCGAPWERVLQYVPSTMNIRVRDAKRGVADADELPQRAAVPHDGGTGSSYEEGSNAHRIALLRQAARERGGEYSNDVRTVGWSPTCRCRGQHGKTVPCIVLDPFGGSGTTGRVAIELGRRAVLLDLAYGRETEEDRAKGRSYIALAKERTSEVQTAFPLL